MMSKKDYELIASSIRKHGRNKEVLIIDLAARLAVENQAFDEQKFIAACNGIKKGNS